MGSVILTLGILDSRALLMRLGDGHILGNGRILFQEHCFGRENSLSSAANPVSSAANSVSALWRTNNRLRGTH